MKPILFDITATAFNNNGLGMLNDAARCIVTEERNGMFELEMDYPISGIHYEEIIPQRIILAKSTPTSTPQAFRIYRITKPLSGLITVYAQHISYDLSGAPVTPFYAGSLASLVYNLPRYSENWGSFTLSTNKSSPVGFRIPQPASARAIMGGTEGSILDVYGGEWEWNNFAIKLWSARGQNRGVVLRYGKNITSLEQDTNISNMITGIYPFYVSDTVLVTLPEKILYASGTFPIQNIVPLDLSANFEQTPSVNDLRSAANSYINSAGVGVPSVSLDLSYAQLDGEEINLCDTVTVEFPALGIETAAKCVKTTYNVLLDRYDSVEIGDARTNISSTIAQVVEQAGGTVGSLRYRSIDNGVTWTSEVSAGVIKVMYSEADGTINNSTVIYRSSADFTENDQKTAHYDIGTYGIKLYTELEDTVNNDQGHMWLYPKSGYVYIGGTSSTGLSRLVEYQPATTANAANACFVTRSSEPFSGSYELCRVTSSKKYKKDIKQIDGKSASETIDALKPVTYSPKSEDENGRYYGFIAEDVEKIDPMLCAYINDKDGNITVDSVQYDRFPVLLVKDAQETHKKIAELEDKIAKLEAKLNADN